MKAKTLIFKLIHCFVLDTANSRLHWLGWHINEVLEVI